MVSLGRDCRLLVFQRDVFDSAESDQKFLPASVASILRLHKDYEFTTFLEDLLDSSDDSGPIVPLPVGVSIVFFMNEETTEMLEEDGYGDRITYVAAGNFRQLKLEEALPAAQAALAYLQILPPDTPVVIYWE